MGVVRHQSKHQSIQDKCCTSASNPEEGRGEGGRVPNTGSSMFEFGWGTKFQRVGEHEHNLWSFKRGCNHFVKSNLPNKMDAAGTKTNDMCTDTTGLVNNVS